VVVFTRITYDTGTKKAEIAGSSASRVTNGAKVQICDV
jgi:hypothetical protein